VVGGLNRFGVAGCFSLLVGYGVMDAERRGLHSHAERGNDHHHSDSAVKKGRHFWQPFRVQLSESRSNQSQLKAPPV